MLLLLALYFLVVNDFNINLSVFFIINNGAPLVKSMVTHLSEKIWYSSKYDRAHIHPFPKWPQLNILSFLFKLALDASFLSLKFKRIFCLERGLKV